MTDALWGNIFRRRRKKNGIVGILREIPVFDGLGHRQLTAIERILHGRQYAPGEVIFHQNDAGVGMYIIESGTVSIRVEPEAGQVAELGDGEFFGEIALLTEFPRSATAVALSPCRLLFLSQSDLFSLLRRDPKCGTRVLVQVAEIIGQRLMASNDLLQQLRAELRAVRKEVEDLRAAPRERGELHAAAEPKA